MQCNSCHNITLEATTKCPACGETLPAAGFIITVSRAEHLIRDSRNNEAGEELFRAEAELRRATIEPAERRMAQGRLQAARARVLFYKSQYRLAEAAAHQAISLLGEESELALLRASAFCTLANVAQFQGNIEPAKRFGEQAVAAAEQAGEPFTLGLTLNAYANVMWHAGDDELALSLYQRGLSYAEEGDNTRGLAAAICSNIAGIYQERGAIRTALEFAIKAQGLAEQASDEYRTAYALTTMGDIYLMLGEFEAAETHLRRAQQLAESSQHASMLAAVIIDRAELAWLRGNYGVGYELAANLLKLAAEDARERTLAYAIQIHCAVGMDRLDKARQAYSEMQAESNQRQVHHLNDYYYPALTARAALLLGEWHWPEAQAEFEQAVQRADEQGDVNTQGQVRVMYADALLTNETKAVAKVRRLLTEARQRFAQIGATHSVQKVDALIASLPPRL